MDARQQSLTANNIGLEENSHGQTPIGMAAQSNAVNVSGINSTTRSPGEARPSGIVNVGKGNKGRYRGKKKHI